VTQDEQNAVDRLLAKAYRMIEGAESAFNSGFYEDAVSRAYYAAFHAVSATLAVRRLSFSSHGQTLGAFNREIVAMGLVPKDTFRRLQRLFEDRHIGDYSATKSIERDNAERDIVDAKWIISQCEQMVRESSPPESIL
jgi:uncharacterized protein (UPF0332 family)